MFGKMHFSKSFKITACVILIFFLVVFIFLFFENQALEKEIDEVIEMEQNRFEELQKRFSPKKLIWEEIIPENLWSARDAHSLIVFQDKLWLMGGLEGITGKEYWQMPHRGDVWMSEDGKEWTMLLEEAGWGPRRSIDAVVFKDKIWIMGGWDERSYKNNVWSSENGINWIEETHSAQWPAREGQTMAVFNDKIWLMGGVNFNKRKTFNDVWYSEDGINWESATDNAGWSPRYDHSLEVFNNKMWVIGGVTFNEDATNDVWSSEDGITWELVLEEAPFSVRHGHTCEVFKDRIWVISGWNTQIGDDLGEGVNDVWFSKNGTDWQKLEQFSPWIGREDHATAVFKDKIFITGGMDTNWEWHNDIWCLKEKS